MSKLYTLVLRFLLAASWLGAGEVVYASLQSETTESVDVVGSDQNSSGDQHFLFFGNSFSPEDKAFLDYRYELRDIFNELSKEPTLKVSHASVQNSIGNPIDFLNRILTQVELRLNAIPNPISQNQLDYHEAAMSQDVRVEYDFVSEARRSVEITIYMNLHGGSAGTLRFYNPETKSKQTIKYQDLWPVIDRHMELIEARFFVRPKVNLVIETCHGGSMKRSLQVYNWKAKRTEFNILTTSEVGEPSHSKGIHTLFNLAFSISKSLNLCGSCSSMEQALQISSQIPITSVSTRDTQVAQLYIISQGRYRQFKFSADKYLKLMNELITHISVYREKLKLSESIFVIDPASLFRKLSTFMGGSEDRAKLREAGVGMQHLAGMEIVAELTDSLANGYMLTAFNSITEFNKLLRTWPERVATSGQMAQLEMGFINVWALAINSGGFIFEKFEAKLMKSLSSEDQLWFKYQLMSRFQSGNSVNHSGPESSSGYLEALPIKQSILFKDKILIRTDLEVVQNNLLTGQWEEWVATFKQSEDITQRRELKFGSTVQPDPLNLIKSNRSRLCRTLFLNY
jgi:hypothetical protein